VANARQHLENYGEFTFGGVFDGGIFGQSVFLYLLGGPLPKVTEPRNTKPQQMKTIMVKLVFSQKILIGG
jgi:hypothetical protein